MTTSTTPAPSIVAGTAKPAGLAQVQKYFSNVDPSITGKTYPMAKFRSDWSELSDKDKTDLRNGLGDGSMTY